MIKQTKESHPSGAEDVSAEKLKQKKANYTEYCKRNRLIGNKLIMLKIYIYFLKMVKIKIKLKHL